MSSRRPQGEGSVYRLPDGRWRGVVDLGWHDGKRRRKYITRGSQAEVVRELRRLTAAAEAGQLPIAPGSDLGPVVERSDEVAAPSVRPSTLRRYRQAVYRTRPGQGAAGQAEAITGVGLLPLTAAAPVAWERATAARASPAIALCGSAVAAGPAERGDRHRPAVADVRRGSSVRRQGGAAVSGCGVGWYRFHAPWLITVFVGPASGVVLGLAWRDVDLDQRVLAVRQTLQYRPGEGFRLVRPKTARSRRIVPLPDAVVEAWKLRREQQETDRLASGH